MPREYEYDEEYDYNPVTDRFIKTTPPQAGKWVESDAPAFVRETEQQRMERIRSEKQEAEFAREERAKYEKYLRDKERTIARQKNLEKKAKEKSDAVDLARERYLEKSFIYRMFHRRLSDKRAEKMSESQINNLYGGIETEKVRKR